MKQHEDIHVVEKYMLDGGETITLMKREHVYVMLVKITRVDEVIMIIII